MNWLALFVPAAIVLIGVGVLLGVNPPSTAPRAGWFCALAGVVLGAVALVLVLVGA